MVPLRMLSIICAIIGLTASIPMNSRLIEKEGGQAADDLALSRKVLDVSNYPEQEPNDESSHQPPVYVQQALDGTSKDQDESYDHPQRDHYTDVQSTEADDIVKHNTIPAGSFNQITEVENVNYHRHRKLMKILKFLAFFWSFTGPLYALVKALERDLIDTVIFVYSFYCLVLCHRLLTTKLLHPK